jgi:adenylate kinase
MRLLIVGPPGAGKGTQATRLAAHYGVPAVSTGDIFRSNIADGTELGVRVKAIIDSGGYVSDEVTNELVRDRLGQPDAVDGFLLDGYPRTRAQVDELDAILGDDDHRLDAVVQLQVDPDELVARLVRRAQTDGRTDDTAAVIGARQAKYVAETAPLLAVYGERGLLVSVDGLGDVDDIAQRLVQALDAVLPADRAR